MTITKKSGRQQVISAYLDFGFADVAPSGVGQAAIDLPVGAQVIGGDFVISTAFNSATSDTFTIGDATLATRYGNAIAGAAARTALTVTGYQTTNAEPSVVLKWTGVGAAPTTGAGRLRVDYIVNNRAQFGEGKGQ